MTTRREFLALTLSTLWLEPHAPGLKRWWPQFPTPHEIWVTPPARDMEEGILLESAAGLAAHASLHDHGTTPLIYEETPGESYRIAFEAYCKSNSPRIVRLTLDEIVARLHKQSIAKGFLLYRYDPSTRPLHDDAKLNESANVATSLAAATSGLVVSASLRDRMLRLGLKAIMDLRNENESACLEQYKSKFSRNLLGTCDPRARHARSLMIAHEAFVCSARGETYHRALARCKPNSPVLGWGCGPEDTQTIASSRAGLYQTATDWCASLH